jgi:hypothetical protein
MRSRWCGRGLLRMRPNTRPRRRTSAAVAPATSPLASEACTSHARPHVSCSVTLWRSFAASRALRVLRLGALSFFIAPAGPVGVVTVPNGMRDTAAWQRAPSAGRATVAKPLDSQRCGPGVASYARSPPTEPLGVTPDDAILLEASPPGAARPSFPERLPGRVHSSTGARVNAFVAACSGDVPAAVRPPTMRSLDPRDPRDPRDRGAARRTARRRSAPDSHIGPSGLRCGRLR